MKFCRGEELQPFPSQYSPFFHLFICQPSINYRPSPSLSTLPSSYLLFLLHFPATSVVPYIPLSLSIFPFPSLSSPPNLPRPYLSISLPSPFLTLPFFRGYPFPLFFLLLFFTFPPYLFTPISFPFLFPFFRFLPLLLDIKFLSLPGEGGERNFIQPCINP